MRDVRDVPAGQILHRQGDRALRAAGEELADGRIADLAVEDGRRGVVRRGCGGPLDRRGRGEGLGAVDPRIRTQRAIRVADAHAVEHEPQPDRERLGRLVAGRDELAAALDEAAALGADRPDATADAIAGLEHLDVDPVAGEGVGRDQTGEPGSDHDAARHGATVAVAMPMFLTTQQLADRVRAPSRTPRSPPCSCKRSTTSR
jgi:hypothetical protein